MIWIIDRKHNIDIQIAYKQRLHTNKNNYLYNLEVFGFYD